MTSARARVILKAATFLLLCSPAAIWAQDAVTVAEGLFREGVELLRRGSVDEACDKLAESQRLDPSSGTLLNLADCHEQQGKTATAWAEFLAASRLASAQGRPERAAEAKRRAQLLEPNLARLKLVLSEALPGTTVQLDNVTLESSALGSRIPVDPGEHDVVIAAPGYQPITLKVTIAEREAQTLSVPRLERQRAQATAGADRPPRPGSRPGQAPEASSGPPVTGYVIGGAGLVALGAGGVFALLARSAYADAEAGCPSHTGCSTNAMQLRDKAETRANIATVGVGVGLVAVTAGVVLLLTHSETEARPHAARTTVRLSPVVSPTATGLQLEGMLF
jgi:tetratricopeptide (TPR) repeat protein